MERIREGFCRFCNAYRVVQQMDLLRWNLTKREGEEREKDRS
jgi:hypothetical protein